MFRKHIWLVASLMALVGFVGLAQGQSVKINFQPDGSDVPDGYLADTGVVFADQGNGFSYGWDSDISANTRDRGSDDDQRYDTLNHLQKADPPAVWEIALESGEYEVYLVCGDPDNTDSVNTMNIEGTVAEDPDGEDNFDEYTVTVEVTDGRLTITADTDAGASNAKISFVDITLVLLPGAASTPNPEDEAIDVLRDVVVSWEAGDGASSHDVYLGASFDDVNDASRSNPTDVLVSQGQTSVGCDLGRLEFGQTYYWRVDEIQSDGTIVAGDVWSFTVEELAYPVEDIVVTSSVASPEGAGPENTIDGSGLNEDDQHSVSSSDMWMVITDGTETVWLQYEFDKAYKLYEMLVWNYNVEFEEALGFGLKDVTVEYSTDGETWTVLGDIMFAQATCDASYEANTIVDFGGVAVQYVRLTVNSNYGGTTRYGLSEIRFLYVPIWAQGSEPADEATDVAVDTVFSWISGREAASHDVYLGTDPNALTLVGHVDDSAYTPDSLDYEVTYYWRVDEVNEAEAISVWMGDVWSFSTLEYLVVEDFESYDDESNRIFDTWIDGWGDDDNGSVVGYSKSPFAEQEIVHNGSQSMPLFYDNEEATIAEADFALSQDWTSSGIKSLSLYFYGDSGNSGQLYVKINTTEVVYNGNITVASWKPWNIDLSTVSANLGKVTNLTIGVKGAGAVGTLYIDDIRLYPRTPEYIVPTEPDNAALVAFYALDGNADDSSGNGLDGEVVDGTFVSPGKLDEGKALKLDDAGYVDLGDPAALDFSTGDWTVTAWFKTAITGTDNSDKGTIYGKGGDDSGGHRYALIVNETTEGIVTLVCDDDSTKILVHSTTTVNDDEWHYVAGMRESTSLKIYVNGYLEATEAVDADYDLSGTTQHNAYIGVITNNSTSELYKFFDGLIDDVHVYSSALSEGEIFWLFGETEPVDKAF